MTDAEWEAMVERAMRSICGATYDDYFSGYPEDDVPPRAKWIEDHWRDFRVEAVAALTAIGAREMVDALQVLLDCPDIADNDHKDEETHAAERMGRAVVAKARGRQ